jgi:hypothetical protein
MFKAWEAGRVAGRPLKRFAAIDLAGYVMFTVEAANAAQARRDVQSVKTRSESVVKVRLLRSDDMARSGSIEAR